MTKMLNEVLAANTSYAANFGDKGKLPCPQVVSSRSSPVWMPGSIPRSTLAWLKATRMSFAMRAAERATMRYGRSSSPTNSLGTREWFVIHHTNCGMELFTDDIMREPVGEQPENREPWINNGWHNFGKGPGSTEGNYVNWMTFSDNAKSVVEDVARIRSHPLVPR